MKIHRIYGITLRFMFYFRRSLDRLSDAFYWPTIDLLIWGITSSYLKSYGQGFSQIVLLIISGILFWIIVWRAQYEITVNLLEDLWSKNLPNIFVSPVKFSEWVSSFIIIGIIKSILSFSFASFLAFLLYKINIFVYGFYLLPFFLLLILTGWWIGFLVVGVILRYGTKLQTLAWTAVMIISPFSAIYYPVSVLPEWAQKVAMIVPTSYVFEGAREVMNKGYLDLNKVYISLILNLIYLPLAIFFLKKSFTKALEKGLVSLY